jgi:NIPSNAP
MTKQLPTTLLGTAVVMIAGAVIATVLSAAPQTPAQSTPTQTPQAGQGGRGPAEPPAPCGPQGQLPGNLSKNVDAKSRCFEIRIYTVDQSRVGTGTFKGGINELHQRFREQELALFVKHGAEILGVWQHLEDPNTLVWMLAYRDRAHREEVWAAFGKDPEWDALRKKYFVPLKTNTFLMSASDYSPMK